MMTEFATITRHCPHCFGTNLYLPHYAPLSKHKCNDCGKSVDSGKKEDRTLLIEMPTDIHGKHLAKMDDLLGGIQQQN